MKLILFFCIVFSLFVSCEDSMAEDSQSNNTSLENETSGGAKEPRDQGPGDPTDDPTDDPTTHTIGQGAGSQESSTPLNPTDSAGGQSPIASTGPCSKYPLNCGNNKICGEKYEHCLLPKAGLPATTLQVQCEKRGENAIVLIVHTWASKPGQNNLLCDFWQNTVEEEGLYLFATNQKDICQHAMELKKQALMADNYQCE